jgi:hypothetical protein
MIRFFVVLLLTISTFSAVAQVNTEKLRNDAHNSGLFADFDISGTFTSGNSEFVRFNTGVRLDYIGSVTNSFLIAKLDYKEADNSILVNKGFVHLRTAHSLATHTKIEIFLQKEFNEFISLKDRNLGGAGFRFLIAENKTDSSAVSLAFGAGLMYEDEDFNVNVKEDAGLVRSTNYLSLNWNIDKLFSIKSVSYYQVDVNNFDNYRVLNESDFSVKIFKNLRLFMGLDYRYDSQPPLDVKNFDLEIVNGIRLTL